MNSGAAKDGRVCMRVTADRGLVKRTKCEKWSTTTRTTVWASEVTCADCLGVMAVDQARIAVLNAAGTMANQVDAPVEADVRGD